MRLSEQSEATVIWALVSLANATGRYAQCAAAVRELGYPGTAAMLASFAPAPPITPEECHDIVASLDPSA